VPWEIIKPGINIDFIGKRRLAAVFSGLLVLASAIAIPINGVRMGIDFAGGTEVQLEFAAGVPASDGAIREVLTQTLEIAEPSVVRYGEEADNAFLIKFSASINEVQAGPSQEAAEEGGTDEGEEEGTETGEEEAAGDSDVQGSDLIVRLQRALEGSIGSVSIERVEFVGPRVGAELRADGIQSLLFASIAILLYIAFRFNTRFAPGAIIAVLHDLFITAGVFVILGMEFDLRILAAMLAILGYSLNDTIIIYDRIRENMALHTSIDLAVVLNQSVNQTLSRTILTSGTTLAALLALYSLGGPVIQPFAFAMILGVLVGTYSSIYVAAPVLLWLETKYGRGAAHEQAEKQKKLQARQKKTGKRGARKKTSR
jgi:preprotein translocase subunit SecF